MTRLPLAATALLLAAGCSPDPAQAPDNAQVPPPAAPGAKAPAPPPSTPQAAGLIPVADAPDGIVVPRVARISEAAAARINAVLDRERQDAAHARIACERTAEGREISYNLSAEETYNGDGLLSFRMTGDAYCGGANGTVLMAAHSFDIGTGEELDVLALTSMSRDTLGDIARRHYSGPAPCAELLAQDDAAAQVNSAYLDRRGIGVLFSFNSGAAESCGAYPAVIPLAEAKGKLELKPPLDRL